MSPGRVDWIEGSSGGSIDEGKGTKPLPEHQRLDIHILINTIRTFIPLILAETDWARGSLRGSTNVTTPWIDVHIPVLTIWW